MLDTVVAAETPEGIILELHPAGLPARFYAFLLDWLIRLGFLYGFAIVARVLGGQAQRRGHIPFRTGPECRDVAFLRGAPRGRCGRRVDVRHTAGSREVVRP